MLYSEYIIIHHAYSNYTILHIYPTCIMQDHMHFCTFYVHFTYSVFGASSTLMCWHPYLLSTLWNVHATKIHICTLVNTTLVWTILYDVMVHAVYCSYLTSVEKVILAPFLITMTWKWRCIHVYSIHVYYCFSCRKPLFLINFILCPVPPDQGQQIQSRTQWRHELCSSKFKS